MPLKKRFSTYGSLSWFKSSYPYHHLTCFNFFSCSDFIQQIILMDHFCRMRYKRKSGRFSPSTAFLSACSLAAGGRRRGAHLATASPFGKGSCSVGVVWPAQAQRSISHVAASLACSGGRPAGDKCVFISHAWWWRIDRLMMSLGRPNCLERRCFHSPTKLRAFR